MKRVYLLFTLITISYAVFTQEKQSLDEIDNLSFNAGPAPFEKAFIPIMLDSDIPVHLNAPKDIVLDGVWQMVEGGDESERLTKPWRNITKAEVPGSVHTALWKAGKIPDPYFGKNDSISKEQSFKTWWFKKEFTIKGELKTRLFL